MFSSLFSKSRTAEPSSQVELSPAGRGDVRSCVSVNMSNSKEYKRERKKSRSRNFRGLFSSDCEDEITSVVSDNPQLYHSHRSCSMSTLGTSTTKSKKNLLMSRKTFDAVEKKMSHIQASLSSSSLMKQNTNPNQQIKEEDTTVMRLKQELEEKEKLAQKLQDQLGVLRASKPLECSSNVDEWEDLLSRKRRQIKKKKEQLRRIEDDGNIDVKISLAEMEYSLEKDQIEMMNLSQKMQTARVETVKARAVKEMCRQESLYKTVQASQASLLQAHSLDREELGGVVTRQEGFGLQVGEDEGEKLQAGDRLIEVNGENVLRMLGCSWQNMLDQLTFPARVVIMRTVEGREEREEEGHQPHQYKYDLAHVTGLKEDIALIQSRLSEKLQEGRTVSLELSAVQQQRDKLGSDNTRLRHRIQYLEDQVTHLEAGMKQVRDSLAQTLNTEIMDTIHKLDKIGRPEGGGGHVAQVQVTASDSSSTSGVYSVEGSEGSNSPEYNSWRSRTEQRWSVQDFSDQKSSHVSRFVVRAEDQGSGGETHNPTRKSSIDVGESERGGKGVERSNSRVNKVSNMMRWPRQKDKDRASANLYVSDTSQV